MKAVPVEVPDAFGPGGRGPELRRWLVDSDLLFDDSEAGFAPLTGSIDGAQVDGGWVARRASSRALGQNLSPVDDQRLDGLEMAGNPIKSSLHPDAVTRGRTTVAIAHRLATAEAADEVIVFDRGRVVQRGPHETLVLESDSVYARLHAAWITQTRDSDLAGAG